MIPANQTLSRIVLTLFIASAEFATDARADVVNAIWIQDNAYNYKIKHMPDLDQRRVLLPGQGVSHCVPSAMMNLFAYAANHGFPNLSPGPGSWGAPSVGYNTMTNEIYDLGVLMGTTVEEGTVFPSGHHGSKAWIAMDGAPLLVFENYGSDFAFPTVRSIAGSAIVGGNLAAFSYGRYEYLGGDTTVHVGERTGGHMVTLVEALQFGPDIFLGVRDPADEPTSGLYLFTQSTFSTRYFPDLYNATIVKDGDSRSGTVLGFNAQMTSVAIIDYVMFVKPSTGYYWDTSDGALYAVTAPNSFWGNHGEAQQIVAVPAHKVILNAIMTAGFDSSVAIIQATDTHPTMLTYIDHSDGSQTDIAAVPGAAAMTLGRNHDLFVASPGLVQSFQMNGAAATLSSSADVPGSPRAMAYNDMTDEVVMLLPDARRIVTYPKSLIGPPHIVNIPFDIGSGGDGAVAINPVDGKVWFATDASHHIYNLQPGPIGLQINSIMLPEIQNPTSLSFDDNGDLFVMTADGLKQLRLDPASNEYFALPETYFGDTVQPTSNFQVLRSRTNFDPDLHTGPAWRNFDPSENAELLPTSYSVVDCDADLNDDGVVDGADLANLLVAWGECDICLADGDGNRIINGADLATLLSAWGPCGGVRSSQ